MARVSRSRCSKSARLSVGDAFGVEAGAGAGDETVCRGWAGAAPAALAGRVSADDLAFAELARLAGVPGGGGGVGAPAAAALARCALRSSPLAGDDPG